MFVILVSQDFALGSTFSSHALAKSAAIRLSLREYQIVQVFKAGDRIIFRESETGPEELGVVRTVVDFKHYMIDLDDGSGLEAFHVELAPAPADAPPAPEDLEKAAAEKAAQVVSERVEKAKKDAELRAALEATIKEYAEYDHPCDYDAEDLDKAHGSVSIHVLRELLARHS